LSAPEVSGDLSKKAKSATVRRAIDSESCCARVTPEA
jgi:hypothetical protein